MWHFIEQMTGLLDAPLSAEGRELLVASIGIGTWIRMLESRWDESNKKRRGFDSWMEKKTASKIHNNRSSMKFMFFCFVSSSGIKKGFWGIKQETRLDPTRVGLNCFGLAPEPKLGRAFQRILYYSADFLKTSRYCPTHCLSLSHVPHLLSSKRNSLLSSLSLSLLSLSLSFQRKCSPRGWIRVQSTGSNRWARTLIPLLWIFQLCKWCDGFSLLLFF